MVQALTINGIFGSPLRAKSFGLFSLADRAISLFTIFPVKGMTILTMSPKGILRAYGIAVDQRVLARRNNSKMSDVHTVTVLTDMIDNHATRYVTSGYVVCDPVRATRLATKIKRTISISIKRELPQMAAVFLYPFTVESVEFLCSNHITHSVPYNAQYSQGVNDA